MSLVYTHTPTCTEGPLLTYLVDFAMTLPREEVLCSRAKRHILVRQIVFEEGPAVASLPK